MTPPHLMGRVFISDRQKYERYADTLSLPPYAIFKIFFENFFSDFFPFTKHTF